MTPQEKALADWKAANPRRKGTATHYANGKPKVAGKTKKEIKEGIKKGTLNASGKPISHGGLKPGYHSSHSKALTENPKKPDWAGDVHKARVKNQKFSSKHYTDKGYREDYR